MWCRPWPNSWNSVTTSSCVSCAGWPRRAGQRVADEVGDRQRGAAGQLLAADAVVHPGAAALVRARVGVEVEAADCSCARGVEDVVVARVRMPDRHAVARRARDAEQPLDDAEQAAEHARQREVRAQLFLRDAVALFLQALGIEGDVPGVELAAGERGELGELALGGGARGARQIAQERRAPPRRCRPCGAPARRRRSSGSRAAAPPRGAGAAGLPSPGVLSKLRRRRALVGGARAPGVVVRCRSAGERASVITAT